MRSQIADNVRAVMEDIKKTMPEGVDYKIVYDTTQFVRDSIDAVCIRCWRPCVWSCWS